MYILLILVALASGARPASDEESTYCALRYRRLCQGKGEHIACQFPVAGPGEYCENYKMIKFNAQLKKFITHYINRRRQRIAQGRERVRGGALVPPPELMMQVEWDNELAALAQRLADQCSFVHDDCRATVRYPYAGQTVGEVKWRLSGESDHRGIVKALRRVLDAWWGERRRVTLKQLLQPFRLSPKGTMWGHFTQLAVWRLRAVGCGAVRHGESHPRILLVCDFSHTNMLGQRTLVAGHMQPCPLHTSRRPRSTYPLLCASVNLRQDKMYDEEPNLDQDVTEEITTTTETERTVDDYEEVTAFSTKHMTSTRVKDDEIEIATKMKNKWKSRPRHRQSNMVFVDMDENGWQSVTERIKKLKEKLRQEFYTVNNKEQETDSSETKNESVEPYDEFARKIKDNIKQRKGPKLQEEIVALDGAESSTFDSGDGVTITTSKSIISVSYRPRYSLNIKELVKQQLKHEQYGHLIREKQFKNLKNIDEVYGQRPGGLRKTTETAKRKDVDVSGVSYAIVDYDVENDQWKNENRGYSRAKVVKEESPETKSPNEAIARLKTTPASDSYEPIQQHRWRPRTRQKSRTEELEQSAPTTGHPRVAPRKQNIATRILIIDKDDEEQIFKDTGFNVNWRQKNPCAGR